ncbi:MAG TPA: hypothetical protein VIG08_05360 [Gemmatimonadales bacterium]|jgi:hypothetical protein
MSFFEHPGAWLAIVGLGCYHGINPGMGWLFAVSNGMQEKRGSAVFAAVPPIAAGHVLAMAAVLLPFAVVSVSPESVKVLGFVAGCLLIGFGLYKLMNRRHPRFLARIGPEHLVLWSFLMATAHGAGLMLVPVFLGLGPSSHGGASGHAAMTQLAGAGIVSASMVALVHTAAMVLAGGLIAWIVYRYLGLRLLQRAWLNLDLLWAGCLIAAGAIGVVTAVYRTS